MQINKISITESIKFAFISLWQNKMLWLKILLFNFVLFFGVLFLALLLVALGIFTVLTLCTTQDFTSSWYAFMQCADLAVCEQFNQLALELISNYFYVFLVAAPFIIGVVLLFLFVSCVVWLGSARVALDIYDQGRSSIRSYLAGIRVLPKLVKFFMCVILFLIMVAAASLFFIVLFPSLALLGMGLAAIAVPLSIFFGVKWAFCGLILVDSSAQVLQALKMSYELTQENWSRLAGLLGSFVIMGSLLAAIPVVNVVYSVVSSYLIILALVYAYRTLQGRPRSSIAPLQTNV